MILLSHPTANQNVRQTALALAEAELLEEFWTSVNWRTNGFLDRCLFFRTGVRKELRRRSFPAALQPFIRTFPWREWGRLMSGQLGLNRIDIFSMEAVYEAFDRRVARRLTSGPQINAIYAYDGGALESFRAAKKRDLKCIYEHPIVYWRKVRALQQEEAALHPEWTPTLLALRDSQKQLARKDEELALADVVITPSTFSSDSLVEATTLKAPVHVVPYGAPPVSDGVRSDAAGGKLRVLFVGALSQAKGLGYLLEAATRLERQIELTLIGQRLSSVIPKQEVLDRHRWIASLPHDELLQEMSRHDVLVLPSLHEGFGLVILEAMAQGTLVITTAHTGGSDVIEENVDGFIVPIRSAEAIAAKLDLLASDRERLASMQQAARRKAELWQWRIYRERLVALAREVIAN